ncbi:hypothetical protein CBR_g48189 [Chara braunii]|uniref:DUF4057 domain-containing protein n=1 Tax=Chara braunii TaxID=69332 RepID=A0A388M248_CHABU|nr:hypothetical protein CBR_g48189 [Chara braunii]|eukprot:GBG88658.1 hypothetical protein CBR_g48189 [Chara braunii]
MLGRARNPPGGHTSHNIFEWCAGAATLPLHDSASRSTLAKPSADRIDVKEVVVDSDKDKEKDKNGGNGDGSQVEAANATSAVSERTENNTLTEKNTLTDNKTRTENQKRSESNKRNENSKRSENNVWNQNIIGSGGHSWDQGNDSGHHRSSVRTFKAGVSQIPFGTGAAPFEPEPHRGRLGSAVKQREMLGSGIFGEGPLNVSANAFANGMDQNLGNYITDRPSVRLHQPAGGMSQICLGSDQQDSTTPKRRLSFDHVAKQKELIGSFALPESPHGRRLSLTKAKEMNGSDIFGWPLALQEMSSLTLDGDHPKLNWQPQPADDTPSLDQKQHANPAGKENKNAACVDKIQQDTVGDSNQVEVVSSRKARETKLAELSGTNIFSEPTAAATASPDSRNGFVAPQPISDAKRREMIGNDIFANHKPVCRDCVGGVRKPPGGESSLSLF